MIRMLNQNIRGMKSQASTERLKFLLACQDICLVAIQEPFVKEIKIELYRRSLDMKGCQTNCSNKIWIFWKHNIECFIYSSENQMVTCKIQDKEKYFFISIIYAKSRTSGREDLWRYMRVFSTTINAPWAITGDFNSILSKEEKMGGKSYRLSKSIPFIECLHDCGLRDIGYTGNTFTWCNERKGRDNMEKVGQDGV